MKSFDINIHIERYSMEELSADDSQLVEQACRNTSRSYAPYSRFHVGAALKLADGTIVDGANQENASFPVGTCAERSAFFFAQAQYPDAAPVAIAIAAETGGHFTPQPVAPCGMCRQALLEAETRYGQPIRVLLYGTEGVYVVPNIASLLPLVFDGSALELED